MPHCQPRLRLLAASVMIAGLAASLSVWGAMAGETTLVLHDIIETKAVYGRVETRDLVPARSRLGGTLARLDASEGDAVTAGQVIGTVIDDKLAIQLRAADAKISALTSEQTNALKEAERAQTLLDRGISTRQRVDQLRMQADMAKGQVIAAQAERSVILQQGAEGAVNAPVSGRIVKVPVTRGAVVLPGEPIAQIAGSGFFLRLALPERHAAQLKTGASVMIGEEKAASLTRGTIAKVFPQIENGRVIADVEVDNLGDYFVGSRILVQVPIGLRKVLSVPLNAVKTRSGLDFLMLQTQEGLREISVILGSVVNVNGAEAIEILTGARVGDRVVTP